VGLTATPNSLWPPNKSLIDVTIDVTVTDDSDPSPACEITGITSNEALDASDWSQSGALEVSLRADRNGLGVGRSYAIEVTCTNASGLGTSGSVTVAVPHDRR
jgi:hypothetical protein